MTRTSLPLAGVRVADFGQLTAGANTSSMLADLGADVIKIESASYLDLFRMWKPDASASWWNNSPHFHFTNRNKRGVSIDLKAREGQVLVLELLRRCDILVENFSRGVLDRLGLGYAAVSTVNPALVYASITSQGETGPHRAHRTYGSTLDAMGGLSALMGYTDGGPEVSGGDLNYPDQVVSLLAAGMIMAALRSARESGQGAHLDISQREIVTFLLGEEVLAASEPGSRTTAADRPRGNAHPGLRYQDCIRARDGHYVAVTVADSTDEARLASMLAETGQRVGSGQSELVSALSAWLGKTDAETAAMRLRTSGIAAEVARDGHAMLADRAMLGDSIVWTDEGMMLKGMPYTLSGGPLEVRQPAPDLGQHTAEILTELLDLSAERIAELTASGILSNRPATA